jgi:hypothetical protein
MYTDLRDLFKIKHFNLFKIDTVVPSTNVHHVLLSSKDISKYRQ